MAPISEPKLRFADAVHAIGTTPKQLRNWLQRRQVPLPPDEAGGWRAFSFCDIALLAIVRRLADHGVDIERAGVIADAVFYRVAGPLRAFKNTPVPALVAGFRNRVLIVWRHDGEWPWMLSVGEEIRTPSTPAFLTLLLDPIISEAVQRADLSAREGKADSSE